MSVSQSSATEAVASHAAIAAEWSVVWLHVSSSGSGAVITGAVTSTNVIVDVTGVAALLQSSVALNVTVIWVLQPWVYEV
jgi:hypothetical protein